MPISVNEPWSYLEKYLAQPYSTTVNWKELLSAIAALANAVPDAVFAKLFSDKFTETVGLDPTSQKQFGNYAAIMTGITSLAINRASLLTAIQSSIDLFKQSGKEHLLDSKFLIAWGVLLLFAAGGAIPGFQFAADATEGWNTGLAILLIGFQCVNFTASNMRPMINSIKQKGFAEHRDLITNLRQRLLESLNEQLEPIHKVPSHDLNLLAQGILNRPNYPKIRTSLRFFTAAAAPFYAISYYFASVEALNSWTSSLRSLIGSLAGLMKWSFMCHTSFSLINKFINGITNSAILAITNQQYLPPWTHHVANIASTLAGITTALSSAGGILEYVLPHLGFWSDANSLTGLSAALGVAVLTNATPKIYDVSEMLNNLIETIAQYASTAEKKRLVRLGENKTQFVLRLMRTIASYSPAEVMLRFTRFNNETNTHEPNEEYQHLIEKITKIKEADYMGWLHPEIPEEEELDDLETILITPV